MNGWNGGWIWILWMGLFWAVIIAVAYALVRSFRGSQPGSGPGERDATSILDERFARGEISAEEYSERRRVLGEMKH